MKIVIIGTGNVGSHLAGAFVKAGASLLQLFNRDKNKIKTMASSLDAEAIDDYQKLRKDADVYILAVNDGAIEDVAPKVAAVTGPEILAVHTSGATPSKVLEPHFYRFGVFYPLQTFSRNQETDFSAIPFCIYADRQKDEVLLKQLAARLSTNVYLVSDEQREVLHVAAVFINNFTNHLAGIGKQIAENENMPFELLLPLLEETVAKLKKLSPEEVQTGPAIRADQATIERHLNFLVKYPEYREIYSLLSKSINKKIDL